VSEFGGLGIKKILHDKKFEAAHQFHRAMTVRFGINRIFAEHIQSRQLAALHGLEHGAEMPSLFRIQLRTIRALEFRAQLRVLHVLKSRQAIRNCAHVAAALHVVLPAQRIEPAAVAPNVARQQPEINQRQHIVHCVVMLGDAEGPANLRALGFGVGVGGLANHFRGNARFALGALQRVLLDACSIGFESAGGMLNELLVGQARVNNLARHGVGQRNVAANVETQPRIRPLRGGRPARINHMEPRAVANALENVMEENRMRLARV
jgi:hypothetical protein